MNVREVIWITVGIVIIAMLAIGSFAFWILRTITSPGVAGFWGVFIGAFVGIFGTIRSTIVGAWKTSKETESQLKDRVSNHALQLAQMDFDLRQKSLQLSKKKQDFLAPIKVYKTFYNALIELHTKGNWPKVVEEQGLMNIFEFNPLEEINNEKEKP